MYVFTIELFLHCDDENAQRIGMRREKR